jgi:hypothetical protein
MIISIAAASSASPLPKGLVDNMAILFGGMTDAVGYFLPAIFQ